MTAIGPAAFVGDTVAVAACVAEVAAVIVGVAGAAGVPRPHAEARRSAATSDFRLRSRNRHG